MIRKIWKKFNVSTIMILPLFWNATEHIIARKSKVRFPFIQLCIEYGLINTYLYKNGKYDNKLYLEFDKEEFTKDKNLTTSPYTSILELLINYNMYAGLEMNNDTVLIALHIPVEFREDIKIIEESKYSKLSDEYKSELHIKQNSVPLTKNEFAMYVASKNLGYAISMKSDNIKKEIEKELKMTITRDDEYYERFNKVKENYVN